MSLVIKNEKLLEKYESIWNSNRNIIKNNLINDLSKIETM